MARKEIAIRGITTTSEYAEGDTEELVNLRSKNGAFEPIPPLQTVRTFENQYSYLFEHKNQDYTHLIGVRNSALYWIHDDNTETLLMNVQGKVSITQIGNIINVLDESALRYAIWNNNRYNFINLNIQNLPSPQLCVSVNDYYRHAFGSGNNDSESIKGIINKVISLEEKYGRLNGFVLAITAYEMFDGTFVYQSMPILLGQPNDSVTRFESFHTNSGTIYSYDRKNLVMMLGMYNADGLPFNNDSISIESNYEELNPNPHLTALHTWIDNKEDDWGYYSGVRTNFSANHFSKDSGEVHCYILSNKLELCIPTVIDPNLSTMIRSLSVFITPQVSMYDFESVTKSNVGLRTMNDWVLTPYMIRIKSNSEIISELMQQNFYKVYEVPFNKLNYNVGSWVTIDLKDKLGDNLYNMQKLNADTSRTQTLPKQQFVYNGRLHIFNYKTDLFEGYTLNEMEAVQGAGQFQPNVEGRNDSGEMWWIEIYLKTNNGTSKVVKKYPYNWGSVMNGYYFIQSDLMPIISYPDNRAYKIRIYYAAVYPYLNYCETNIFEFDLTPSKVLNFAYYISPQLKPIEFVNKLITKDRSEIDITTFPDEINPVEIVSNGMKVSEINNPLYFPVANTQIISTGTILGAATNAMNVTERNFGTFPVFVATTEGWFMLNTANPSSELVYATVTPITSSEIPTNSIICSTPLGVVFGGKRGIYLLNSSGTKLITPQIEQPEQSKSIEWNDAFNSMLFRFQTSYSNFFATLTDILYNANENELIVVNSSYSYNIVINLETKQIYKTTEVIISSVKNTYPELLVSFSNTLKDISKYNYALQTHVSLTLRPFNFGTRDIKKMERIYLRGTLYNLKKFGSKSPLISLFESDDNVNYKIVKGTLLNEGNYRDIDSGLLARTKFRWYMFSFAGMVDEETRITSIEAIVDKEYENEKMR